MRIDSTRAKTLVSNLQHVAGLVSKRAQGRNVRLILRLFYLCLKFVINIATSKVSNPIELPLFSLYTCVYESNYFLGQTCSRFQVEASFRHLSTSSRDQPRALRRELRPRADRESGTTAEIHQMAFHRWSAVKYVFEKTSSALIPRSCHVHQRQKSPN